MFLNQSFDLSAINRHVIFESQVDWVLQTCHYVLANNLGNIAIRQHPCERLPGQAGTDNYEQILKNEFGDNELINFIPASAPLNSYDLINAAEVVLTYVSTIGIEAAFLGKKVILQGTSFYRDSLICTSPKTRDEYFASLLSQGASLEQDKDAIKKEALAFYFLSQKCGFFRTEFTPTPSDYLVWIKKPYQTVTNSSDFKAILECVWQNKFLVDVARERFRNQSKT